VVDQVGDLGAEDFVLAGQAIDVRARTADPAAFDDARFAGGSRQVPSQVLSALAAAQDEVFVVFSCGHVNLLMASAFSLISVAG
jgi:hypothetical protein